jgi:hypothetical protein
MMSPLVFVPLIASFSTNKLWYLAPLVVSISLVYGATRHELIGPILHHAFRSAVWIIGFMAIIFAVLMVMSWLAG